MGVFLMSEVPLYASGTCAGGSFPLLSDPIDLAFDHQRLQAMHIVKVEGY